MNALSAYVRRAVGAVLSVTHRLILLVGTVASALAGSWGYPDSPGDCRCAIDLAGTGRLRWRGIRPRWKSGGPWREWADVWSLLSTWQAFTASARSPRAGAVE